MRFIDFILEMSGVIISQSSKYISANNVGIRTVALMLWSVLKGSMNSFLMSVEVDVLFFFGKVDSS